MTLNRSKLPRCFDSSLNKAFSTYCSIASKYTVVAKAPSSGLYYISVRSTSTQGANRSPTAAWLEFYRVNPPHSILVYKLTLEASRSYDNISAIKLTEGETFGVMVTKSDEYYLSRFDVLVHLRDPVGATLVASCTV